MLSIRPWRQRPDIRARGEGGRRPEPANLRTCLATIALASLADPVVLDAGSPVPGKPVNAQTLLRQSRTVFTTGTWPGVSTAGLVGDKGL
jgi:hypothetical protein